MFIVYMGGLERGAFLTECRAKNFISERQDDELYTLKYPDGHTDQYIAPKVKALTMDWRLWDKITDIAQAAGWYIEYDEKGDRESISIIDNFGQCHRIGIDKKSRLMTYNVHKTIDRCEVNVGLEQSIESLAHLFWLIVNPLTVNDRLKRDLDAFDSIRAIDYGCKDQL